MSYAIPGELRFDEGHLSGGDLTVWGKSYKLPDDERIVSILTESQGNVVVAEVITSIRGIILRWELSTS